MKAAYLIGESFATSSNGPALCREFNHRNVRTVTAEHLTLPGLKDVDFLMLPGITGEKSPYPEILPSEKAQLLYRKMHDDGMIILAECAAFYWASREISYLTSAGQKLEKKGLGWIDGIARGPSGKGLAPDQDFKYADTTTAEIEFYQGDKAVRTAICISNGPALYLSDAEEKNPAVRVTSRFTTEKDYPVATMTKIIGNGMLVGIGVLPHIKTMQLGGVRQNPGYERHRIELFNTISANEPQINRFEKLIFDQIRSHHDFHNTQMGMPNARFS